MLIIDYPFAPPSPRALKPRLQPLRVFGIAATLVLHLGVLLYLCLPTAALRAPVRPDAGPSTMRLVWIEPDTVVVAPPIVAAPTSPTSPTSPPPSRAAEPIARRALQPATTSRQPVVAENAPTTMTAEFIAPHVDPIKLQRDMEEAAAEIVAKDKRLPNAGMPSALGKVPGRAEEFVHLPLPVQTGNALTRALAVVGKHLIVGGIPENPLHDMAERGLRGRGEPVCNDPENPLADERCWLPPDE